MSFSALPIELAKAILSELRHSPVILATSRGAWRADLASCSLVARSWRGLSQELLFENLEITLRNNFDIVYDADRGRGRTLEDFLRLIEGSPHLASYINELSLAPRPMSNNEQLDLVLKSGCNTIHPPKLDLEFSVLASVVAQLPGLESICLHSVDPKFTYVNGVCGTLGVPRALNLNVEHLHLSQSYEASGFTPHNLFLLVSGFPHLNELSLWWTHYTFPPELSTEPLEHLAPMRCLRRIKMLDGYSNQAHRLLRVAADRGCLPSLEMLDIGIDESDDVATLQALLDCIGGQLSWLRVHYNRFAARRIAYASTRPVLNFAPCTRLVHLSFRFSTERRNPQAMLWRHFLRALALPAQFPVLRTLMFEYSLDPAMDDAEQCNAPLDEAHARILVSFLLAVRSLKRVEFRAPVTSWCIPYRAVEREHLRARLAELDRKGLLFFA